MSREVNDSGTGEPTPSFAVAAWPAPPSLVRAIDRLQDDVLHHRRQLHHHLVLADRAVPVDFGRRLRVGDLLALEPDVADVSQSGAELAVGASSAGNPNPPTLRTTDRTKSGRATEPRPQVSGSPSGSVSKSDGGDLARSPPQAGGPTRTP